MNPDPLGCLRREAARFDLWATRRLDAERDGSWEASYPFWPHLLRACEAVFRAGDPETWDAATTARLLHVLARDSGAGVLRDALLSRPRALLALAPAAWEAGFPRWSHLLRACEAVLEAGEPAGWSTATVSLLLHVLARDEETERLLDVLVTRPRALLVLARADPAGVEPDAGWQLAAALGWAGDAVPEAEAEALLVAFLAHPDEYVRRRALIALGDRRSLQAEAAALRAWDTGEEYQRIAALHALHAVRSPLLAAYRERAAADGRRFVVAAAEELRPG